MWCIFSWMSSYWKFTWDELDLGCISLQLGFSLAATLVLDNSFVHVAFVWRTNGSDPGFESIDGHNRHLYLLSLQSLNYALICCGPCAQFGVGWSYSLASSSWVGLPCLLARGYFPKGLIPSPFSTWGTLWKKQTLSF